MRCAFKHGFDDDSVLVMEMVGLGNVDLDDVHDEVAVALIVQDVVVVQIK